MNAKPILDDFFKSQERVLEWGVLPAKSPLPHSEHLKSWVKQDHHAGLRYMQERLEERANPAQLFPWAKSIVLFSLRQSSVFGTNTGDLKVAAYALGEDYHHLARKILAGAELSLRENLTQQTFRFHGFCDTWPVFERDIGAEVGLGWRGKNACLIHPRHGSGFLLAGFFTDLQLETPTLPLQDFCGQCTACLDLCPTGALIQPGHLDANKCISFWTIEAKGEIPESIATKTQSWIFGCDICQDVCPWNHKPKKSGPIADLEKWPKTAFEWLALLRQGGGFQSRFKNTPLLRAGRRSLLRNVLVALRSRPKAEFTEILDHLAAEETDPIVLDELKKARHP